MSPRATAEALQGTLRELDIALEDLRARAADQGEGELSLATVIADRAVTMRGALVGARADAPADVQRRLLLVARELEDLMSHDAIADVQAAGRESGAGWRDWAIDVRDALEACRAELHDAEDRLLAYWQEMTETSDRVTSGGEQRVR
jgi:hypothetical protein